VWAAVQVAAREEELDACQQRLAASKAEVREVKELLQASLQPRIAMDPMPRLISLASAATDMGYIVDAEELRRPLPQGTAQQQRAGIARDPTLSTWQGRLAAEEAQRSAPAVQQVPIATRQSRGGAAVPDKHQSGTEARSSSPSKKSKVKRSAAVSSSPRGAAAVNSRENADSTCNREVLSGPKPVHGRLLWKVERSPSPLDVRCVGSLHSAPSTPLSPTNASMAPTRRLPQSERADSGAYAKV
jgi:hypothetical protein